MFSGAHIMATSCAPPIFIGYIPGSTLLLHASRRGHRAGFRQSINRPGGVTLVSRPIFTYFTWGWFLSSNLTTLNAIDNDLFRKTWKQPTSAESACRGYSRRKSTRKGRNKAWWSILAMKKQQGTNRRSREGGEESRLGDPRSEIYMFTTR